MLEYIPRLVNRDAPVPPSQNQLILKLHVIFLHTALALLACFSFRWKHLTTCLLTITVIRYPRMSQFKLSRPPFPFTLQSRRQSLGYCYCMYSVPTTVQACWGTCDVPSLYLRSSQAERAAIRATPFVPGHHLLSLKLVFLFDSYHMKHGLGCRNGFPSPPPATNPIHYSQYKPFR